MIDKCDTNENIFWKQKPNALDTRLLMTSCESKCHNKWQVKKIKQLKKT